VTKIGSLESNSNISGAVLPWPPHPACTVWPQMSDAELQVLADDIANNGLHDPVTLAPEGLLLDGRNRALACVMAGVEPKTTVFTGDPVLLSLSRNARRRHMSQSQIAIVAATLTMKPLGANQYEGGSNELPSIARAAETAGVTETAIKSAKAVLRHGTPEEVAKVKSGSVPVRKMADTVRAWTRASALPKPQTKPKSVKPSQPVDPIDNVAREIVTQCADGKWRSLPQIATTVRRAEDAARKALRGLGETGVAQRKNGGGELEYWIAGKGDVGLRHALAARDEEIARLKARVAELEADMERHTARS
jgi:hypothetical protein